MLGYHVPERNHPDTPALIMLNEIIVRTDVGWKRTW
jgi:hypothetical protein